MWPLSASVLRRLMLIWPVHNETSDHYHLSLSERWIRWTDHRAATTNRRKNNNNNNQKHSLNWWIVWQNSQWMAATTITKQNERECVNMHKALHCYASNIDYHRSKETKPGASYDTWNNDTLLRNKKMCTAYSIAICTISSANCEPFQWQLRRFSALTTIYTYMFISNHKFIIYTPLRRHLHFCCCCCKFGQFGCVASFHRVLLPIFL